MSGLKPGAERCPRLPTLVSTDQNRDPPTVPPCAFPFTSCPPSPQSLIPLVKYDLTLTLPQPSNCEVSILKHLAKGVKTPPTKHFLEELIPNKAQENQIRPPLKTCVKEKKVPSKARSTYWHLLNGLVKPKSVKI